MDIIKNIKVPTGNICIGKGDKGLIEFLSIGGYDEFTPYKEAEHDLKNAGFDVLVFVPSKEEDESRITCGNAVLSESFVRFI